MSSNTVSHCLSLGKANNPAHSSPHVTPHQKIVTRHQLPSSPWHVWCNIWIPNDGTKAQAFGDKSSTSTAVAWCSFSVRRFESFCCLPVWPSFGTKTPAPRYHLPIGPLELLSVAQPLAHLHDQDLNSLYERRKAGEPMPSAVWEGNLIFVVAVASEIPWRF